MNEQQYIFTLQDIVILSGYSYRSLTTRLTRTSRTTAVLEIYGRKVTMYKDRKKWVTGRSDLAFMDLPTRVIVHPAEKKNPRLY